MPTEATTAKVNYGSYAGECLAAVWAVRYFRVYLYGAHFILYTDHRPLEWLMTSQSLTRMHVRWALIMSEFDFEVKYRKGLVNMNANGLSQSPQLETEDNTDIRMHKDLPGELIEESPLAVAALLKWSAWAVERPKGVEISTVEELEGELWDPPAAADVRLPAGMDYGTPDVELHVPAEQELGGERAKALTDVWEDEKSLQFLRGKRLRHEVTEKKKERVRRRCWAYRFADRVLLHKLATGEEKMIPLPAQREPPVAETHGQSDHWGERQTVHLVQKTYWWAMLQEAVQKGVETCNQCNWVKANFTAKMTRMQSLPILGLGYRWSLDFAGPLITTRRKNRYVLIAIERFSKWCEVWPMPTKQAAKVAEAFLGVMTRFGACAEVLTDNGMEFQGEFEQLCQKLFLDHRWTLRYHPSQTGRRSGS
jgi:hypothetical protein